MGVKMNRKTLTVVEAAEVLGVGRSVAYEAARSGAIPTIKIGHRVLVLAGPLAQQLGIEANDLSSLNGLSNAVDDDHITEPNAATVELDQESHDQ